MTDWAVVIIIGLVLFAAFLCLVWRWWYKRFMVAGGGGLALISIQYSETSQMIADTILLPLMFMKE